MEANCYQECSWIRSILSSVNQRQQARSAAEPVCWEINAVNFCLLCRAFILSTTAFLWPYSRIICSATPSGSHGAITVMQQTLLQRKRMQIVQQTPGYREPLAQLATKCLLEGMRDLKGMRDLITAQAQVPGAAPSSHRGRIRGRILGPRGDRASDLHTSIRMPEGMPSTSIWSPGKTGGTGSVVAGSTPTGGQPLPSRLRQLAEMNNQMYHRPDCWPPDRQHLEAVRITVRHPGLMNHQSGCRMAQDRSGPVTQTGDI